MRKVLLLLLMFTVYQSIYSQTSTDAWYIGISLELGLPTGTFGTYAGIGFGGNARIGYLVDQDFMLTLGSGYFRFGGSGVDLPVIDVSLPTPGTSVIPLLVGAKYFFSNTSDTRPYAGVETGLYFVQTNINVVGFKFGTGNSSSFGVAPMAGVSINSSDRLNVDAMANYSIVFDALPRWVGFRGGIDYRLNDD